ncbi:ImmA/IrrE family metallo-endopeptidase [Paenibacillus sp. Dod16]|uniref:ImmA/IrrE family metallo-endopeptidase n=1 Tax=Paenibacillus sp. Dod16 TaxID=3416392 RepID=UPI003CFBAA85
MRYDALLLESEPYVYEMDMPLGIKGLYGDNVIWINKHIPTRTEKACVLAEELGHHYTSAGNILDIEDIRNKKQELRARMFGYEMLIPLGSFIEGHRLGIRNRYELAEHLSVTEDYLEYALSRYREKYGLLVSINNYTICFEPLGVLEFFEH